MTGAMGNSQSADCRAFVSGQQLRQVPPGEVKLSAGAGQAIPGALLWAGACSSPQAPARCRSPTDTEGGDWPNGRDRPWEWPPLGREEG